MVQQQKAETQTPKDLNYVQHLLWDFQSCYRDGAFKLLGSLPAGVKHPHQVIPAQHWLPLGAHPFPTVTLSYTARMSDGQNFHGI